MTPAMASAPYCAEAPSRRISIRPMAADGIWFRSVGDEPLPMVPEVLTQAELCTRRPLIRTRVESGDRPRRLAERIWVLPSGVVGLAKANDGAS